MAGFADTVAEKLAEGDDSEPFIGVFQAMAGDLARVIVADQVIPVAVISAYHPIPGQSVWVKRFGRKTYLLGPAASGAAIGQVVDATEAPIIQVKSPPTTGVTASFGAPTGMALSVGQYVVVDRFVPIIVAGPYTLAALPVNAAPPDPDAPVSAGGRQVFQATDTGSFNGSSWWTNEVYDSVSNDGASFYGNQIADTLPDTATITSAKVFLPLKFATGDPPILRLHFQGAGKPSGDITFGGPSYALPVRSGWVDIPTTFADAMRTATYGLGFEASTGGYSVWYGTQADGQSFALDISWT